jgi:hypothetical protein
VSKPLAIEVFVRNRLNDLGLAPTDLVRRAGYKNVAKGLRRLDELYAGNFESAHGLIERLPSALELPSTLGSLQKSGIIRCNRGMIKIKNKAALEAAACECYRVIRSEF